MSEHADEHDFIPRELSPVETVRHSTAHLMASAVAQLYPGTKFGIGPHIEHGFYYDMDVPETISEGDLPVIEQAMRKIAKGNHKFQQHTLNRDEALAWVQSLNIDGGGWRMPTTDELEGLYKAGTGDRNMTPLLKTTGWYVWSGETKGSSNARFFNFFDGNRYWYLRDDSYDIRAFAVRSRSDG